MATQLPHPTTTLPPPCPPGPRAPQGTPWLAPRTWMRALYRWHRAKQPRVLMRFLSLGAPGGAVMGLECAAFEVTTALAGHLGAVQVAAHASAFSLAMLAFMAVPVAIAIATGIRCVKKKL